MQRVGSRAQVMRGTAKMTSGGLMKKHLTYNNSGKIVSIKASKTAKNLNKLVKAGYQTNKGQFGAVRTMRGGDRYIDNINESVKLLAKKINELTDDILGIYVNIDEQYMKESINTQPNGSTIKDSISTLVGNLDKNINEYAESMKGVNSKDNKKEKIYRQIIKGIKEKGIQIRDTKNRTKNNSEKVNIYELNTNMPKSFSCIIYYPYIESFKGLTQFDEEYKNRNINMNTEIIWRSLYYYYEWYKENKSLLNNSKLLLLK